MGKVAVLKIRSDDLKQGFLVSLQICQDDGLPLSEIEGARLPTHPDIESCYLMWQTFFRGLKSRGHDDWEVESSFTMQRSTIEGVDACREWVKSLETNMQDWLQESSDRKWQQIREKLVGELANNSQDVRVMIKANPSLWKLPWHTWDLLKYYPDLGISFSPEDYNREEISRRKGSDNKVNILAIFGDDGNIDLQPDRLVIANLKGARTEVLNQPTASDFIKKVRSESGWDILFFAGHSETKDNVGRIYISKDESLEIEQFKNALKSAINNGLKIAIFNSCEGLGLAEQIAKLQIPVAVFMQEKVPDRVAQSFLKEFLTEYAKGQPLQTAFRRAQSRLEEFTTLPGATWLPKLYQNLGETPPTWEELRDKKKPIPLPIPPPSRPSKPKLQTVFIASFIVTSLVMGVRSIGWLQSWELQAYDAMMRMRPSEPPDPRLLIVGADKEDIDKYNYPLRDGTLAKVIDKLQQHQPIAIGLDIYRNLPVPPGYAAMIAHFQQNKRLIAVCKYKANEESVDPPPKIPVEQIGFSNLPLDEYNIVRRYFLSRSPNTISDFESCKTNYSFGFQLAYRYLYAKKIPVQTPENNWQFGNIILKRLGTRSGGYQNLDGMSNQTLLNYRASSQIAQQVTVRDILNDRFEPSWVKDKIVLIGVIADSVKDPYNTPYGIKRGLYVHAHAISEILSAVEDKRPLLRWLPLWGDAIWIGFWSLIGGGIVWFLYSSPLRLWLAISISIAILYALCFGLFIQGFWLPLVPSAFALLVTRIAIVFRITLPTKKGE
ncbi:CHASE2 domain-containing protein [Argonema galeatum]|uniref:CHASE2 domain-containing protein n=1 Tax=Argonema galeatum TaxID=2942762 RepID=UPI002013A426|nr:CHASE2 domain-containing protein [Argonema galeatum]MCL1463895.1 CHASE2 domain-containing protein [Argonema galeatum A003/A1]